MPSNNRHCMCDSHNGAGQHDIHYEDNCVSSEFKAYRKIDKPLPSIVDIKEQLQKTNLTADDYKQLLEEVLKLQPISNKYFLTDLGANLIKCMKGKFRNPLEWSHRIKTPYYDVFSQELFNSTQTEIKGDVSSVIEKDFMGNPYIYNKLPTTSNNKKNNIIDLDSADIHEVSFIYNSSSNKKYAKYFMESGISTPLVIEFLKNTHGDTLSLNDPINYIKTVFSLHGWEYLNVNIKSMMNDYYLIFSFKRMHQTPRNYIPQRSSPYSYEVTQSFWQRIICRKTKTPFWNHIPINEDQIELFVKCIKKNNDDYNGVQTFNVVNQINYSDFGSEELNAYMQRTMGINTDI